MAFAYLNVPGRIWKASGLQYVFYPQGMPDTNNTVTTVVRADITRKANTAPVTPQPPVREEKRPNQSKLENQWKPTPTSDWPRQWQEQFSHAKRGHFAWTYMDLGKDLLMGQSGKSANISDELFIARRQCLKRMISDLSFPAGTHTFWPVALPSQENKLVSNRDCFWSGVDSLGCRGVIIMGSAAAHAAMETTALKPLDHLFKCGKSVWIIWEPHVINQNSVTYIKVLTFLRRALKNFIRI